MVTLLLETDVLRPKKDTGIYQNYIFATYILYYYMVLIHGKVKESYQTQNNRHQKHEPLSRTVSESPQSPLTGKMSFLYAEIVRNKPLSLNFNHLII